MQLDLGTFYTVTVILHCKWGAGVNGTKCSVCQVPHSFMWSALIGKCHHLQLAKVQPQVIFSIKPGFPDGKTSGHCSSLLLWSITWQSPISLRMTQGHILKSLHAIPIWSRFVSHWTLRRTSLNLSPSLWWTVNCCGSHMEGHLLYCGGGHEAAAKLLKGSAWQQSLAIPGAKVGLQCLTLQLVPWIFCFGSCGSHLLLPYEMRVCAAHFTNSPRNESWLELWMSIIFSHPSIFNLPPCPQT